MSGASGTSAHGLRPVRRPVFWKSANGIVFALSGVTYPSPLSSPIYEIRSATVCPAAL
jgi:predicted permease